MSSVFYPAGRQTQIGGGEGEKQSGRGFSDLLCWSFVYCYIPLCIDAVRPNQTCEYNQDNTLLGLVAAFELFHAAGGGTLGNLFTSGCSRTRRD